MLVENSNAVQKFLELDNGETAESGVTTLSNIQGTNTVVAEAATTITAYVDKEIYVFTVGTTNTGAMTLNIDSVGAKAIVKNHDQAILEGEMEATQVVAVMYNASSTDFEWLNVNDKVVDFYEGTSVASATTTDIWANDGNTIHVTGTTACTSFGTAPNVGARRFLIYDAAVTLTNSTNLHLQGETDYTTSAGDMLEVYADTTSQFDVIIHKISGTGSIVQVVNTQTGAVATGTTTMPFDDTIPQNTEGDEFITLSITPKNTNNLLLIEVELEIAHTTTSTFQMALFQDSTANALAAITQSPPFANIPIIFTLSHFMTAGTTSATTFKARAGSGSAGTTTLNGSGGSRRLGGVIPSSITITEIAA